MPNGMYIVDNQLVVAGWGVDLNPETFGTKTLGHLLQVNLKDKSIKSITTPFGNLDGLSQTLHGAFVTDWLSGKLFYYSTENNTVTEVLDLPKGSADTYFDKKTKSIFIPLMLDNKLLKYSFKK